MAYHARARLISCGRARRPELGGAVQCDGCSGAPRSPRPGRSVVRTALATLASVRRAGVLAVMWALGCGDVDPYDPYVTSAPTSAQTSVVTDATASTDTGSSSGDTGSTGTSADGTGVADESTGACPIGTEGCPCTPGGACDPALACLSNVCVDPGALCPVGSQGCPCTRELACDPPLVCDANECIVQE